MRVLPFSSFLKLQVLSTVVFLPFLSVKMTLPIIVVTLP